MPERKSTPVEADGATGVARGVIGANCRGEKELLAVRDGFRESEQSWKELLLELKDRGMEVDPKLAIADGPALPTCVVLSDSVPGARNPAQRCYAASAICGPMGGMPKPHPCCAAARAYAAPCCRPAGSARKLASFPAASAPLTMSPTGHGRPARAVATWQTAPRCVLYTREKLGGHPIAHSGWVVRSQHPGKPPSVQTPTQVGQDHRPPSKERASHRDREKHIQADGHEMENLR
jgi:hypothetical protein